MPLRLLDFCRTPLVGNSSDLEFKPGLSDEFYESLLRNGFEFCYFLSFKSLGNAKVGYRRGYIMERVPSRPLS